jgi:hypothetical protein
VIEGARKQVQAAAGDLRAIRERLLAVQRSIPPSAQEVSPGDLVGEPDGETKIRTVIANGIENCLNPLIDDFDAAADEDVSGAEERSSASIAGLDLGAYTEATRRALYEIVAAEIFGPPRAGFRHGLGRAVHPGSGRAGSGLPLGTLVCRLVEAGAPRQPSGGQEAGDAAARREPASAGNAGLPRGLEETP